VEDDSANTEDNPLREEYAKRRHRLRNDRWMIAKSRRRDASANDDARGFCAECAKPAEGERRMPAVVPPRLEMVADEDRVEAHSLGKTREV
jgi:hypothetical protein